MDLLKAISEIYRLNEKYFNDDDLSIERRLQLFNQKLELIATELEITELESFFLIGIFKLQVEEEENIFFSDVVEKLSLPKIEALGYYNAIEGLEEKGLLTKIIHNEKSIEEVRYSKKISIIPYYNEEYKLTKKAIDKILK